MLLDHITEFNWQG